MFLSFQYGLRPTRVQHRALERILEKQRLLYNAALEERIEAWRKARTSITTIDQTKSLTTIRQDDLAGYGALPANLSRWSLKKVDEAFQAFFRRVKVKHGKAGFPRFRGRAGWRSFGFSEFSGVRLIAGKILFKGLAGGLKLHLHRPLPAGASIRSCVFTKDGRAWRVTLQVEVPDLQTVRREAGDLVGIDWGVETLATLSTGERIENPRLGIAAAAGIRRAARRLARAKRGSRRLKTKAQLARLQRKLANRRRTHLHQVSATIARRFGAIAVEELRVTNMTASAKGDAINPGKNVRQKAGLNREILDTSPGMLIGMLRYKAARAGGRFVAVDARNTSQDCSGCGAQVRKDLNERIHKCVHCDLEVHRDVNAARNVRNRAVAGPWSGFAQQLPNVLAGGRRSGNLTAKIAA
ncbi:putative transposase [Bradyrhizobium sp. USDA 4341]